jgi:hypothetical protein
MGSLLAIFLLANKANLPIIAAGLPGDKCSERLPAAWYYLPPNALQPLGVQETTWHISCVKYIYTSTSGGKGNQEKLAKWKENL